MTELGAGRVCVRCDCAGMPQCYVGSCSIVRFGRGWGAVVLKYSCVSECDTVGLTISCIDFGET